MASTRTLNGVQNIFMQPCQSLNIGSLGTKRISFSERTKDLEGDTGMSAKTIRKYRNQLVDAGLIQIWRMHWVNPETQKRSEKSVMAFRVLR